MSAGYSGTPLVRKLGLKPGMRVRLLGGPATYWDLLGGPPASLEVTLLTSEDDDAAASDAYADATPADFSHLFATTEAGLAERFAAAREGMAEDGMVWASWPKKSSGVASEIGRADVMAAGKAVGLVDVKVCAVDATWSGLKFVIPVADRLG
ncbi:MAG: DUF3052 domain-containing protein [Gemmatimonadota bacterium]